MHSLLRQEFLWGDDPIAISVVHVKHLVVAIFGDPLLTVMIKVWPNTNPTSNPNSNPDPNTNPLKGMPNASATCMYVLSGVRRYGRVI